MIEGTLTLTRTGSVKVYGQVVWSATSNGTAANTSTVTAKVQLKRPAGFTTTGTWKGSLNVGGETVTISHYGSIGSSWVTVKEVTVTVSHNADGTGSCYIYAKVNGPGGTSLEGVYVSGSVTVALETIARYASAVSVTSFTDEGNPVLTYSNPAGETVDELKACISLDGTTELIAYRDLSKTGTSYTFKLTTAERNKLRAATPNSNTLSVWFVVYTLIGEASGTSKASGTMTIVNANPVVSPAVVDTNTDTIALTGDSSILVALHSIASVKVNASAQKSATIPSGGVKVEHGSVTLTGDGALSPVTNNPIRFTVTDSRKNITSKQASNTIIPYINPTCLLENALPDATGNLDLTATGAIFDGSFGASGNAFSMKYRYKEGSGSYTSWIAFDEATLDGNHYTAVAAVAGLNYQSTYTFQAMVIDSLHPDGVLSAEKKFVAKPTFDWSETDFNFNVPVSMSGNKITGLATPETAGDAIPYGFKDPQYLAVSGGTMTGAINMNSERITGLPEPTSDSDAATKKTVDTAVAGLSTVVIKKVWENIAPTSAFAAQTLSLALSDYDLIQIVFSNNSGVSTDFIPKVLSGSALPCSNCIYADSAVHIYSRTVTANFSAGTIAFTKATRNAADNNAKMVPAAIYGIKGVT